MHRSVDMPSIDARPMIPASERITLRATGTVVALIGAAFCWQNWDRVYQTILDIWMHTVLPAFHALHISGLGLCS